MWTVAGFQPVVPINYLTVSVYENWIFKAVLVDQPHAHGADT